MKIGRVIRATDKRARGNVSKALFARDLAIAIELLWGDVFNYRQMLRRRTKVLPHGQNFAPDFSQVVHRLKQFGFGFAQSEHDTAFGDDL